MKDSLMRERTGRPSSGVKVALANVDGSPGALLEGSHGDGSAEEEGLGCFD